jgi:hypothetical protein
MKYLIVPSAILMLFAHSAQSAELPPLVPDHETKAVADIHEKAPCGNARNARNDNQLRRIEGGGAAKYQQPEMGCYNQAGFLAFD